MAEYLSKLRSLLVEQSGIVTFADVISAGIPAFQLSEYISKGYIEKVAYGVYISPDVFEDPMYIAQLRKPKIVYSHETALFLHDLTDRDPIGYSVTVPRGYSTASLSDDGFTVYTTKPELYEIGKTKLNTIFGNEVTAYDMERTICDCIRSRNKMDIAVVVDAVKRYAKRRDKDLLLLMEMATMFRVSKPLASYLEIAL